MTKQDKIFFYINNFDCSYTLIARHCRWRLTDPGSQLTLRPG